MRRCRPSLLVPARGTARDRSTGPFSLRALLAAVLLLAAVPVAITASTGPTQKKQQKPPELQWDPPQVDSPVPSLSASPPCSLPDVLKLAGDRAQELIAHLQNFDAREHIRYKQTDDLNLPETFREAKFDYLVDFGEKSDVLKVHETRTPLDSGDRDVGAIADRGLAVLALIFNPLLQSDYEMRCEGAAQWNDHPAWVVYFRQIKGKPARTFEIRTDTQALAVSLKGRAWIAADSGQVMHLETNLAHGLAEVGLQAQAVSVDYAPVKFQSRNLEVWLPQSATAYCDYRKHRMIIAHTFSDFQLFSVQTQQTIEKPKAR